MLLHDELMDLALLEEILTQERWRCGAAETAYVLPFLDDRCRSLPEAELLTYVVFAGISAPEVNQKITLADGTELTPDLWFVDRGMAVEYEGSQHQEDRAQYNADIDRYAAYRRNDVPYEQVTKELMRSPKATVRRVYAALVRQGYDGPSPDFGSPVGVAVQAGDGPRAPSAPSCVSGDPATLHGHGMWLDHRRWSGTVRRRWSSHILRRGMWLDHRRRSGGQAIDAGDEGRGDPRPSSVERAAQ